MYSVEECLQTTLYLNAHSVETGSVTPNKFFPKNSYHERCYADIKIKRLVNKR